jgi:hypothetical protein
LNAAEPNGEYGVNTVGAVYPGTRESATLLSVRAKLPYGKATVGAGNAGDHLKGFLARLLQEFGSRSAFVQGKINTDREVLTDLHPANSEMARWFAQGEAPEDWTRIARDKMNPAEFPGPLPKAEE